MYSENHQTSISIDEKQRHATNEPLVKMIACALDGVENYHKSKGCYGSNYKYLLNQCIRQYLVPDKNIHISQEAKRVWESMGFKIEDIYLHTYQDPIIPMHNILVRTYKGTKKKLKRLNLTVGKKISFNSVFIEEHTTPVKDVTMALMYAYQTPNCDKKSAIIELLDKMHITKMLKYENEKIKKNTNRININYYIELSSEFIFDKIVNADINYPKIEI